MEVRLPERTTPLRPRVRPHVTHNNQLVQRRQPRHMPERVVRVRFDSFSGREYCYLCRGEAGIGSEVEVDAPLSGTVVLTVIGLGRNGHDGPLKYARLVS